MARELIHRLQGMRRAAGFDIADHIVTYYSGTEALAEVGLDVIEITSDSPSAFDTIEALRSRFSADLLVGAGTVLSVEQARGAVQAGAEFVVAPNTDPDVIGFCRDMRVAVMPGVLTPSEIVHASELGAEFVKVFPARAVGTSYITDVLAPLPDLRLVPTGGVSPDNAEAYLRAGAFAVGIGSAVVNSELAAAGDWAGIGRKARRLSESIAAAKYEE